MFLGADTHKKPKPLAGFTPYLDALADNEITDHKPVIGDEAFLRLTGRRSCDDFVPHLFNWYGLFLLSEKQDAYIPDADMQGKSGSASPSLETGGIERQIEKAPEASTCGLHLFKDATPRSLYFAKLHGVTPQVLASRALIQ